MRIVVTGALGHIGSRLIRALPERLDAELVLVDNLSTQRYCSLLDLPAAGRHRFIEADVLRADLEPIVDGADVVVHLAAITDAPSSFDDPEAVERVNYDGAVRVAQACAAAGAAILFPSTTSVYGTQQDVVDEDCALSELRPQSPYAASKLRAEQALQRMAASGGVRVSICRFGTIFGPSIGMRFHTAVNKFCWQAATGRPLTVWRTAMDQVRPYLDLGDAVAAVAFILERKLFDGRVYNVLTTNSSVRDIVSILRTHVPDLSVQYVDTPIMNQLSYHVSSERFRGQGFTFTGTLAQGIGDTMRALGGLFR